MQNTLSIHVMLLRQNGDLLSAMDILPQNIENLDK